MKNIDEITNEQAIKCLPDRNIIHCFTGSFGADWNRDSVIKELKMAKTIAWVENIFGHNLAVEAGEKSIWYQRNILRFDVRKPSL